MGAATATSATGDEDVAPRIDLVPDTGPEGIGAGPPGAVAAPAVVVAPNPGGRDRILREARALFTRHGFAAVSMQQIADAAGVNKATLYHHYRDKEALFLAVVERERALAAAAIDAALAAEAPLRARMLAVAERMVAGDQADIGRLMADLKQHVSAERREAAFCQRTPPWDGLRRAVAEAVASGEARPVDPEMVGRLFFVALMSEANRLRGGDPTPADPAAIVGVLFDGIAAR